jgi:predicted phage terminase large subunit-like protein
LFAGTQCHSCKNKLLEDVDLGTAKVLMTRDQKERQTELSDQVFRDELNKARQAKDRDEKEFNRMQGAKKELAQRALSRRRLMPFVKRFNPEYQPGWVHIDIAVRLERFSEAVANKESPRLMLFLPPRHGKSELASKTFPAWHLGQYPRHEVIASSYAADLAMDFSRKVRGILADPDYQKVFTETKLDKKSQSAERWNTSVGGGYVAAGVGGAITGRGAHIGIIDDPIKNREDAESAGNRQKIKDWYTSTFYTRLSPGGGILVILTRWHDDDLAGWLLDQQAEGGDQWEVVKYPAISTADEFYRKKGEPLHAERYPLDSLERIKRAVGERDWSALYQQNPVPDEGAYFQKDWFRYYEKEPPRDKMKIYQAWDFAIGQAEHNDYTVGVTIGVAQDDKVYLLDVCRGKWDALEIVEKMIDTYVAFKPQIVGVERGQIEMALGPMLNKRMRERKVIFGTELLKTGRRDKQARARPLQARMQQGMVLLPKHADMTIELKNEMLRFPAGTHDDQVDAFAWCFQMLDKFTIHRDATPKKEVSWKDKLSKFTRGGAGKRPHMRA